jgi:hypothetical protein
MAGSRAAGYHPELDTILHNGQVLTVELGFSRARARGRALRPEAARDVWGALSKSEAVKTGLLEDLDDTILMVEGISSDIVSDIATNVIREPLIRYTKQVCETYGIPLINDEECIGQIPTVLISIRLLAASQSPLSYT